LLEKTLETRRDHWGGNVNYKSLFWFYKKHHEAAIQQMGHHEVELLILRLHEHGSTVQHRMARN